MSLTNHQKTSAANAPKLGAMRKLADGGFIGKLFGASKPETITEKFARQDAEFKAKHPERFQDNAAPAQAAPVQPAPAGLGGIRGMTSGSIARNLQDREKAAGLYKGGAVRKKCVEGGEIKGPGGPTDDQVPIDGKSGQFMLKAKASKYLGPELLKALNDLGGKPEAPKDSSEIVPIDASNTEFLLNDKASAILGPKVLAALNDLGDEPKNPKADKAEDAKECGRMKCGGAVRNKVAMADGGLVADPLAGQYGHAAVGAPIDQGAAMDRKLLAQSAASAVKPVASNPSALPAATATQPAIGGKVDPAADPLAGQYGHAAIGAPVDQGAAMDRKLLAQSAAETATQTPSTAPQQPRQLRRSTIDALNSYKPLEIPELKCGGAVRKMAVGGSVGQKTTQQRISNFPTIPGLFKGGAVRKMAVGGPVDPLEKRVASIPTGGSTAPEPDGYDNGNEFTRNVNNSLNALGGMGVVASVPLKAAQAGQVGLGAVRSGMNAAPVLQNGMARLAGPAAQVAQAAPDFVAGATGVQRVGGANLPSVISNTQIPIAKATNVALQEGAKANQMAANTRTLGNASAGLGMLDGGNQLPAGAPGAAPTSSTGSAPVQPGSPAHGLGISSTSGYQQRQGQLAPDQNAYHGDLSEGINAAMKNGRTNLASTGMRANDIYKTKMPNGTTAYSGYGDGTGTVGGIVNGDGTQAPGRGTVSAIPGMGLGAIRKALINPDGSEWSAADNAIMAANLRDGVDQYRGTSRDSRNDPMNQPMTKDQRAAKVRIAEIAAQDRRYSRADAIAQEQLGMTREEHVSKMAKEQQLAEAQAEYLAAGDDPMKLKIAERKLIILGGKQPAPVRAFAVPGGQAFDEHGMPYTVASDVFDPDTKQWIQRPQAKAAMAMPNQDAIAHLKSNPNLAAAFDAKYGPGASKQILGR